MNHRWQRPWAGLAAAAALALTLAGCGAPPAEFRPNAVYFNKVYAERERAQEANLVQVLTALFGTPDDPHIPSLSSVQATEVLNPSLLSMAAGPVSGERLIEAKGLYREHCAHCHGISGDGIGPTAPFLNPYPRDYRMGIYKFKSTPGNAKPTRDDLRRIVVNGVPGTAMPSFKLLAEDQVEALVEYVIYLGMRGEVERKLIDEYANELDPGELLYNPDDKESHEARIEALNFVVQEVVSSWQEAQPTAIPAHPHWDSRAQEIAATEESILKGRELFFGKGACFTCHGASALGDGTTTNYDDWTKDLHPGNNPPQDLGQFLASAELQQAMKLGALAPRHIRPRNLRQGVFRGGRRPVDIYWRIRNGIAGTGMPAANLQAEGEPADPAKMTEEDIWHLVDYVRTLPYEDITRLGVAKPALEKAVH